MAATRLQGLSIALVHGGEVVCARFRPGRHRPRARGYAEPRFFTISEGQRLAVQFRRKGDAGVAELILERYKLRRTGPLT